MRCFLSFASSMLLTVNALITAGMNASVQGTVYEIAYAKVPYKCLDLPGGDTTNGNKLWMWDCNGLENQKWVFVTYANGAGKIVYAQDPSKCVDVPGGDFANGNQLALWDCNGLPQQNWL